MAYDKERAEIIGSSEPEFAAIEAQLKAPIVIGKAMPDEWDRIIADKLDFSLSATQRDTSTQEVPPDDLTISQDTSANIPIQPELTDEQRQIMELQKQIEELQKQNVDTSLLKVNEPPKQQEEVSPDSLHHNDG